MEETPELDRFYRENKDSVNFLVLAVQDNETDVRNVFARYGADLPVLMDSGQIATSYRVTGVPAAWAITPDGTLAGNKVGYSSVQDLQALVASTQ